MSADIVGSVPGESLARLTRSIRSSFAAISNRWPGALCYGDVPLRGALERRVYQEALTDPASLQRLVAISGDRTLFAEWNSQSRSFRKVSVWGSLKAWARLIVFGVLRATGKRATTASSPAPEFLFYVLRPRFLAFFLPVIEQLGPHRCSLICDEGYGVESEAARHGLRVCKRQYARIRWGALRRVPRSLFPLYSIAVVEFLKSLGTLRRCRPRTLVFAEAASFHEEIMARAAQSLDISTIRMQYGRAGIISPGYYEMPYTKMLMWGEGFVDRLKQVSPGCRYVVTGSPLMDKIAQPDSPSVSKLFPRCAPVLSVISQPECENISRQNYAALVAIIDRVLGQSENVNVLVRLHPADKATDFADLANKWPDRMRVTTFREFPLETVIGASTLVAGIYSTVLSEAAASGVLPVVVRLGERHVVFPSPEDQGAAALARTSGEAVDLICRLVGDADARSEYADRMRAFARRYFGPMDGGSVARIAAQIENPA